MGGPERGLLQVTNLSLLFLRSLVECNGLVGSANMKVPIALLRRSRRPTPRPLLTTR